MEPSSSSGVRGQRFLTLNTVVRVNQIEATREDDLGQDEAALHSVDTVSAFRAAVAAGWPGAAIIWSLSWRALHDERPNYRAIRRLMRQYHEQYGDDVTFIPGGYFANAYNTRAEVSRDLHDGLAALPSFMGAGYRPRAVIAGFLAAENLRYLAETEKIQVCQGNIWSQFSVDNQDGDGSICYPYYPSTEHFCKPAQSHADHIDCVNLDGWTMDFLAARRAGFEGGFNSRMGVGPIETLGAFPADIGLAQMLATAAVHFDTGFALNDFAWVTNCWEICLVTQIGRLEYLTKWLAAIRARWPDCQCVTLGEFGLRWRNEHADNTNLAYQFQQTGTGIGGSDSGMQIRWFMNQQFRLALLRNTAANGPEQVIDYTRYDRPAAEPTGLTRQWSLLGAINQKGTRPQDAPVPLTALPAEDRALIDRRIR